jgi:hypothetical protein
LGVGLGEEVGVSLGVSLGVAVVGCAVLCVASTDGVGPADVESRGHNFQAAAAPPDNRTRAATMGTTKRAALRLARLALATIPPGLVSDASQFTLSRGDGELVSQTC